MTKFLSFSRQPSQQQHMPPTSRFSGKHGSYQLKFTYSSSSRRDNDIWSNQRKVALLRVFFSIKKENTLLYFTDAYMLPSKFGSLKSQ
jgi:hypothetical protein